MKSEDRVHAASPILQGAEMNRRSVLRGGGLLLTAAAAGGAFAPAVKASTRAKAILSTSNPIITSVSPSTVAQGEILTINGQNFGNLIENLCIGVVSPGNSQRAILRALSATDTQATALVHTIPAGMTTGNVVLATGIGTFSAPPLPSGYEYLNPSIFWRDDGTPPATSEPITLLEDPKRKVITCSSDCTTAVPGSNFMTLNLTGFLDDCDPGATLAFDAHFTVNDPNGIWPTPSVHFDEFVDLCVKNAMPFPLCTGTICQTYETIFFNEVGLTNPANNLTCTPVYNPATGALDIFLQLPGNIVFKNGFMCSTICA